MRSGWTWLLLGWLMLAASARAEPEPLRVEVVSSSFVLPGRIARLDALGTPAGVRFQQRVVDPAATLPADWPAGADLVLLDTPRPTDVEQVMAVVDGPLQKGKVPWLRVGGGAPASGHLPAEVARRIAGYYGNGGEANIRTLAAYLQAWRSGAGTDALPLPQVLPVTGYSTGGSQWLDTPQALQAQWQHRDQATWPKVAVLISGSMLSGMQTQVLDALIEAGRARRIALFGVWFDAAADAGLQQALRGIEVDALVNLTHLQNGSARATEFSALDVPVLQALNHRQSDADDWRAATTGIPMATLATFVAVPEAWGASDPIVVSANARGELQPIPEQIDALAAKLQRLAALRHTAAADKRLALLFWNAPDGERNLSASHLNVPRSIEALLPRLVQAGYSTQPVDETTLIERLQALLGGYYHPERLDALLDAGLADTLPVADYRRWLATLPASRRDELRAQWGDPAHHPAVRQRHGQAVFVLPRLRLGNLLLMPQPPRAGRVGEATHDTASVPSHYYLAAYLYLRQQWKADALIHFGTHGTQEWTPGKDRGLWAADYPWLAVGELPVFYPYIQDNVGEAIQAKRRGRAVVVSHQTPPFAPSGLYDELRDLHAVVHELQQLDQGPVRDATAARLRTLTTDSGIAADLGWSAVDMQARFDSFLPVLHDHLHELARRNLPLGLHTFGQPASPEHRLLMVMQQLGPDYLKALGEDPMEATAVDYRQIQQGLGYRTLLHHLREGAPISSVANPDLRAALQHAVQLDAALADTQEIESLLHGLAGGFVRPGAGGDPIRTPELRSGRNLFAFEPDRIPTRAAFDTGELALQQLLQAYRDDHDGQLPRKLAISLWSSEAIRHLGVLEAQVLHALGLRPRWDSGGKVIALDIVPDADLQRPRIDVVIQATSVYRDQFDPFLRLLAGAIEQLAAMPASPGNPIAGNARAMQQRLQRDGVPAEQAQRLSRLRIFSNAPGEYGSGLNHAVLARGGTARKDDAALASGFLDRLQHGYGSDGQATTLPGGNLFAEQLRGVQAAVLSRSSNTHGLLSTDHPFEYLGGLALAVRHLDGASPALYVSDLREPAPRTRSTARFLADELRAQTLNPQWIGAMQAEGYAGTLEVLKNVDNLFGWQVTAPDTVRADQWQAVHDTFVRDSRQLGLAQWFEQHNASAQVQMIERLQEAITRGYWQPDDRTRAELQVRLQQLQASSASEPAPPQAHAGYGLGRAAAATPASAAAATAAQQPATVEPAATPAPKVRGQVMRRVPPPTPHSPATHWALAVLLGLLGAGAALQARRNARRASPSHSPSNTASA